MGRYNFTLWDTVLKVKHKLPDQVKQKFHYFVEEVARMGLDAVDSAAHNTASAITMRCSS